MTRRLALIVAVAALAGPVLPADERVALPGAVRLRYTAADREASRYQYVPFEVPEGTGSVTVTLKYDKAEGANVVDLGVMEPGPIAIGTTAFRGWSGGARETVVIGENGATPGYWPGPLPSGRWHVVLGLYKVGPAGVTVDVSLTPGVELYAPRGPLPARPPEPVRRGARWYSGGLHMHTVHSDGTLTVAELSARARDAGLDFIAVTDHNNTSHQTEAVAEDGLLRIVGEEITTPGGHANAWGIPGARTFVDFRVIPGDPRIAELVRAVTSRGGVFGINHPGAACDGCGWQHAVPDGVGALEITNGSHDEMAAAIALWDKLLGAGRRITGVGSSDWHRGPRPVDMASVRVFARELSTSAILEGIRNGRVVVMADGRTPPPLLVARAGRHRAGTGETLTVGDAKTVRVDVTLPLALVGGRVDLVAGGAVVESRPATTRMRFERKAGDRYLRVHVFGADGSPRALTNPVYLE